MSGIYLHPKPVQRFAKAWLPVLGIGLFFCVVLRASHQVETFLAISLAATWLVACLLALAVVDLFGGLRATKREQRYVRLPVIWRPPERWLPWLAPFAFFFGVFVGNEWW